MEAAHLYRANSRAGRRNVRRGVRRVATCPLTPCQVNETRMDWSPRRLIGAAQAAEYLGLRSADAAKRQLLKLRVPVHDLGRGRGLGLRWRIQDIDDATEALRRTPGAQNKPARTKKQPHAQDIFDLPVREQARRFADLTDARRSQ